MTHIALILLLLATALGASELDALRALSPEPPLARGTINNYLRTNAQNFPRRTARFPTIPSQSTNPYLAEVTDWVRADITKADTAFERDFSKNDLVTRINGTYGSRTLADQAFSYLDAAVYSLSGAQREEAVARAYRRLHLYFREYRRLGANPRTQPIDDFFFGVGTAFQAAVLLDDACPGLISSAERRLWAQAMRAATEKFSRDIQDPTYGRYFNRDLGIAAALLHAGQFTGDATAVRAATDLMEEQAQNIYPDGAYAYIGDQNECPGYHGSCVIFLANFWRMTGSETALNLIRRSKAYYPLTVAENGLDPYWTASSWKTAWNGASINGAAVVAHLTNDGQNLFPWTRDQGISAAFFYRSGLRQKALSQNIIRHDRNIQGPRGRFGRFLWAATGRPYGGSSRYPGKVTITGAMMTNPTGSTRAPLNAALKSIYSHVATAAEDKWNNGAYLITNENNALITEKNVAAIASVHDLEGTSFGPSRRASNWQGRQLSLMLPDRVVTLAEVLPKGSRLGWNVSGRLKLGYGRSGKLEEKELVSRGANRWQYGDLNIIRHASNYSNLRINRVAPILRDEATRATELVFSDGQPNGERSYPASYRKYFLTEVRPTSTSQNATVTAIRQGDQFRGIDARLNGQQYLLVHNVGGQRATFRTTSFLKSRPTQLFRSSTPGNVTSKASNLTPGNELSISLNAGEAVVVHFSSVTAPPATAQRPYKNMTRNLASTIQFEDFDEGGAGVAYSDADSANRGGAYRPSEQVDVQVSSEGGHNVGWTAANEWLEYTVAVTPGRYDLDLRAATPAGTPGKVRFTLDGTLLATVSPTRTGDWQSYQTFSAKNVEVPAGKVLRATIVDGAALNLNWFRFKSAATSPPPAGGDNNPPPGPNSPTDTGSFADLDFYFWDFGAPDAPLQSGARRFTRQATKGFFRWVDNAGIRDTSHTGGELTDNFRRSIIWSRNVGRLRHQLQNGVWTVQVEFADGFTQNNQVVRAEGVTRASNIDVPAKTLRRVTFDVEIRDGQLDLELDDSDATKNWTVAGLIVRRKGDLPSANPPAGGGSVTQTRWRFDFGTASSPVFPGWTRVTPDTRSGAFRWLDGGTTGRDRGRDRAEDDVRRDLIFGPGQKRFQVDTGNGTFRVKIMFGDYRFRHDNYNAVAEGVAFSEVTTTPETPRIEETKEVEVRDENLTITFRDNGGSDANFSVLGVLIDKLP